MYEVALSLWRTCVPYVVGFVVVQAARLGIKLDNATVTSALVAGFGTVYYAAFRLLEAKYGTKWGWFLGAAKPPSYEPPAGTAPVPVPAGPSAPVPVGTAPAPVPAGPSAPTAPQPPLQTPAQPPAETPEQPIDYSQLPEGG